VILRFIEQDLPQSAPDDGAEHAIEEKIAEALRCGMRPFVPKLVVAGEAIRVGPTAEQAENIGQRIPAHRERAETECYGIDVWKRQDKKRHNAQVTGGGWRDQTAWQR